MEVEAMLADSVVTAEGKFFIQGGGWEQITVLQIPAMHDRLGVAALIRVPYTATNQAHEFEVFVRNADANELPIADAPRGSDAPDGKLHRLGTQFNMGRPPHIQPGDDQHIPIAVNLNNLAFEAPGQYSVVIEIDGTEVKRLPFRVQLAQQMRPVMR